jgi:hypothetical protein
VDAPAIAVARLRGDVEPGEEAFQVRRADSRDDLVPEGSGISGIGKRDSRLLRQQMYPEGPPESGYRTKRFNTIRAQNRYRL